MFSLFVGWLACVNVSDVCLITINLIFLGRVDLDTKKTVNYRIGIINYPQTGVFRVFNTTQRGRGQRSEDFKFF